MKIIHFITHETDTPKERILFMSVLSGLSSGLLLAIINRSADQLVNSELESRLFIMYLLSFFLYIYTQRYAQHSAIEGVEAALQKVRLRIVNKVRQTELHFIEKHGSIAAYAPLTQGTNMISQAVMYLVLAVEATIVILFSSLYLLWLSPPAFIVTIVILGIAIPYFISDYHKTDKELNIASQRESSFFDHFNAVLSGFKELKINKKESDALYSKLENLSTEAQGLKINSNQRLMDDVLLSTVTFYFLLLLTIFILPQLIPTQNETIYKITATILFMTGSISMLASAIPNLSKTNIAIKSLYKLEADLDSAIGDNKSKDIPLKPIESFQEIHLSNIGFDYDDKDKNVLFSLETCDLKIKSGEILFLVGGNGSGKSTLLKLITSLYFPDQGNIYIDGVLIDQNNYENYRELFSVVFSQFHLFDRLYGLENINDDVVNYWLEKLELANKTHYENGCFSNTNLSTGQRKRLAFIVAVLKNRPICIFDEVAADQDPQFRHRFYKEILPELQKEGRTIIMATHDEKYFDCCDRLILLEDGKIINQKTNIREVEV